MRFTEKTKVQDYLKWKQRTGMIDNAATTFHNLYNEIFEYNRLLIHKIKDREAPFWKDGLPRPYKWNALHARSHVVGHDEPDKIRAVFGATKLLLQAELSFIWPLQATYLNTDAGRMLWGREMNRGGWRRIFQEMHERGPPKTVLGVDWSQFDRRLLHQLIKIVHKMWRSYFDFTSYERTSKYPNGKTDPDRIEALWEWMTAAIVNTPILLPNGQLWNWTWNGFGSGYQQTQLMDSFTNAIMLYTCLSSLGVDIESEHFWARFQGDDSLLGFMERMFFIYGPTFLTMLERSAAYYFNAKLSLKKSFILGRVTGAVVLSYQNVGGLAFRDEVDLLRHLYFPEKPQDYARLAASALGLALASLGCSDRFYQLCKRIWTDLVVKKDIKPKFSALKWLKRVGMDDLFEQISNGTFPEINSLREMRFDIQSRTESEKQRQWPTEEREHGFYFLDEL
jgi:hypothetical protein